MCGSYRLELGGGEAEWGKDVHWSFEEFVGE
jgi:hypothetical protein